MINTRTTGHDKAVKFILSEENNISKLQQLSDKPEKNSKQVFRDAVYVVARYVLFFKLLLSKENKEQALHALKNL